MTISDTETEILLENLVLPGKKRILFSLSSHLYEKLSRHLFLLKATNKRFSQSEWICDAINEGLEIEKNDGEVPKERKITLSIDDDTLEKLDERVLFFKKIYSSFSRTKWIDEAVSKKLDRESNKLKDELQKLNKQRS